MSYSIFSFEAWEFVWARGGAEFCGAPSRTSDRFWVLILRPSLDAERFLERFSERKAVSPTFDRS
jgi:hypothetical protein